MKRWLCLLFSLNGLGLGKAHAGDPVCAKVALSLHKGPGANFPVSWKPAKYMPFLKVDAKNGWVKLQDFEGETHWAQPHDLTTAISCVVVKSSVAFLRQSGMSSAPLAEIKSVDRYTPLKKLEAQGEWLKVEDETGRQAWIHETNVWKPLKVQSVNF